MNISVKRIVSPKMNKIIFVHTIDFFFFFFFFFFCQSFPGPQLVMANKRSGERDMTRELSPAPSYFFLSRPALAYTEELDY